MIKALQLDRAQDKRGSRPYSVTVELGERSILFADKSHYCMHTIGSMLRRFPILVFSRA
jgi:hypothetical protein